MIVRRPLPLLGALLISGFSAQAAHTHAELLIGSEAARAGETVLAGVRLRMDKGWHTYWQNSGASGAPTTIEWDLPKGVTAGAIQWPVPEKLPDEDLTTYIYRDEVVLLIPLHLAADLAAGPLEIKARIAWLECEVICQKGKAGVESTLTIGSQTKPAEAAALLATWQKKLPQKTDKIAAHAWWETGTNDSRPLVLEWKTETAVSEADFYPDASERFEVQGPTERVGVDGGTIRLRKLVKKLTGDWPARISGVAIQGSSEERVGYEVDAQIKNEGKSR